MEKGENMTIWTNTEIIVYLTIAIGMLGVSLVFLAFSVIEEIKADKRLIRRHKKNVWSKNR